MAEKYCIECFTGYNEEDSFCSKCGKKLQYNILDTLIEIKMSDFYECFIWQKDKTEGLKIMDFSKMIRGGTNSYKFMDQLIGNVISFNTNNRRYDDFKIYFRYHCFKNEIKVGHNQSVLLTYSDYEDIIEESCIETFDKQNKTVKMPLRQVLYFLTKISLLYKNSFENVNLPIILSPVNQENEYNTKINKPLEDLKGKFLYQHPVNRSFHTQKEIEEILEPELNGISNPYKLTQLYVHYMDFVGISIFVPSNLLIDLTETFIRKRLLFKKYTEKFNPDDIFKMLGLSIKQ